MPQANHLDGQSSPYLLQHLYNPVDWYPWGEEAFEKAKKEENHLQVLVDKLKDPKHKQLVQTNRLKKKRRKAVIF